MRLSAFPGHKKEHARLVGLMLNREIEGVTPRIFSDSSLVSAGLMPNRRIEGLSPPPGRLRVYLSIQRSLSNLSEKNP